MHAILNVLARHFRNVCNLQEIFTFFLPYNIIHTTHLAIEMQMSKSSLEEYLVHLA